MVWCSLGTERILKNLIVADKTSISIILGINKR